MSVYRLPLDELPDPLPIAPLERPFDVTITPPGSKSITCRAYVLAALAKGESKIVRPLRADDTDKLLEALCTLGAEARWVPGSDGEDVYIKGVNGRFPCGGEVNLGDGGTPTRFMIACACLAAEPVVVDGSPRMRQRPIAEGVDMLRQLGAHIEYVEEEGRLPVRVVPSAAFKGGELQVGKTASSQFISALMLIAPFLERGLQVHFQNSATSAEYIHLTWSVLSEWDGVSTDDVLRECQNAYNWDGPQFVGISPLTAPLQCHKHVIEPDASSAVYWFAAATIISNARVLVHNLDRFSPQPDQSLIGMFQSCGAHVVTRDWSKELDQKIGLQAILDQPAKTEVVGTGTVKAQVFHGEGCPDGAVLFAVCAALAEGRTTITGLRTLRVKETDRIAALANELRKIGCTVETTDDTITITPMNAAHRRDACATGEKKPPAEPGAKGDTVVIETYNDHRMAMAFAVLGLVRPGISIANPKCVAKSYPGFWRDFALLYEHPRK